ncbi:OLC1v1005369C1 [Oldenlandia corymbosa var. corymbosa]|uniref:OLC1v1005369C1 n=1 Tax=Oldenlandia corymbosa var. corymbosa TaxID=529605 RepID=A0AAV1DGV7_OLDCO|nr:OLC1v1005369C1 [Oldenlandia corymbosa var. corymbosa]
MKLSTATLNRTTASRLFFFSQTPVTPPSFQTLISFPTSRFSLRFSSFNSEKRPLGFSCYSAMAASPPPSRSPVQVRDTIDLTPKEKQIFDRLLDVLRYFNLQTQLRVAGGWVRDKLLGKDCYDIDIALDDMFGREFCEKVNQFLTSVGEETQGIGVIQCNPEQSKHLETARMRLFDEWIDFVNLRSEDYSDSSRIPTMRFGTAEEDAYRRDLTINSLFYNINKNSVEDFTGRGKADLKSGRIVTPLPPKQTFLDDPLRVLRAIRFGARFEFELDEELKAAASDDEVRAALEDKISRERIGHEIDLMVSGNQPVQAVKYISELQLFGSVFSLPLQLEPSLSDGYDKVCVAHMDSAWKLLQAIEYSFTADQQRLCLYAALFLPFREVVYKDSKAKTFPVVNYIIRNSLKLKSSDAETIVSLHIAAQRFVSLMQYMVSNEDVQFVEVDWKSEIIDVPAASKLRILVGLLLRDIKDYWQPALILSMLLNTEDIQSGTSLSEVDKKKELYKVVEESIVRQGLDKIWGVKPLVNGKQIMSVLNLKTGGPLVREWQQKLLEWQLAHPSGTEEECIDWMTKAQNKRARTE